MIKRSLKSINFKTYGVWIALIIIYACFYFTSMYGDILITYQHGLIFLDCIKEGDFFNFYSRSLYEENLAVTSGLPACYSIPVYILFGLWNLPCWIFSRFAGGDAMAVGCLLWLKLIVVIPLILIIPIIRTFLSQLDCKDVSFGIFFFLTSYMVVYPAMGVVQYDTPSLALTLLGIWMYSKEKNMSWKTLMVFSIAVTLKLFALFPFIILTLIKEKRVIYIIRNILISLLLTIISNLLFINNEGFKKAVNSANNSWFDRLSVSAISAGLSSFSIFFTIFLIACVLAFFTKANNRKDLLIKAIWLNALLYWGFFSFVFANPYWIILFAPFIIITSLVYEDKLYFNFWVEQVMEITILVLQGVVFFWVYWGDYEFSHLILKNVQPQNIFGIDNLLSITQKVELTRFYPVLQTTFIIMGLVLLIFNNPWFRIPLCWADDINFEKTKRMISIIRLLVILGLFALNAAIVFVL